MTPATPASAANLIFSITANGVVKSTITCGLVLLIASERSGLIKTPVFSLPPPPGRHLFPLLPYQPRRQSSMSLWAETAFTTSRPMRP